MDPLNRGVPINCTAGAVPVKNEKGELKQSVRDGLDMLLDFVLIQSFLHSICVLLLLTGELTMKKVKVSRYVAGKR